MMTKTRTTSHRKLIDAMVMWREKCLDMASGHYIEPHSGAPPSSLSNKVPWKSWKSVRRNKRRPFKELVLKDVHTVVKSGLDAKLSIRDWSPPILASPHTVWIGQESFHSTLLTPALSTWRGRSAVQTHEIKQYNKKRHYIFQGHGNQASQIFNRIRKGKAMQIFQLMLLFA